MSLIYPAGDAQVTPNIGLATWGMDEVLAENMILIDAAIGGPTDSIKINGSVVPATNFINSASVTFTVVGSNVSATSISGVTPGGASGDIQYNNGGVFGGTATATGSLVFNSSTGTITLTQTSSQVSGFDILSNAGSFYQMRFFDNASQYTNGTPGTVIASGISTLDSILISGHYTGSGAGFVIHNPTNDENMLGVWSDIVGPAVVISNNILTGGPNGASCCFLYGVYDNGGSNLPQTDKFYTLCVDTYGSYLTAPLTNTSNQGWDTGISRISPGVWGMGNGTRLDVTGQLNLKSILVSDTSANTDLTIKNTTVATLGVNVSSPVVQISGSYFGAAAGSLAASTPDLWTLQDAVTIAPASLSGTTAITTFAESSGSVVTLTLASQSTFIGSAPIGGAPSSNTAQNLLVEVSGFPSGAGSWLNGYVVRLLTATATSLTFTDPTSHGTVVSTPLTGSPIVTQTSTLSQLQVKNSGSGGGLYLSNTTASTATIGQASPFLILMGTTYSAGASAPDAWSIQKSAYFGADVSTLVISHFTPTVGTAGTAVAILASVFVSATGLNISGASHAAGTSLVVIDPTPSIALETSNSGQGFGQVTFDNSSQSAYWGCGMSEYTNGNQFEFWGGSATSVSGSVMVFAPTTGDCGIGFNSAVANYLPGSTLVIFNQKATTGATQLLVQGGAVAADASTNVLLKVNAGGGTSQVFGVLGNGTAQFSTDTGISRLGAASLALGNGTASDTTGNLSLNRINKAGADFAGQATVTAGNTTQAVTFAANYTGTGQPVIVLTPTSDPLAAGLPVGYWVTYSGGAGAWSGFTVNIQTALAGNVTFNYIVVGVA